MTDRELMKAAAKAAGLPITGIYNVGNMGETIFVAQAAWNPLTDDGDAFRLAVARNIGVQCHVHEGSGYALASHGDLDESFAITVEPGDDPAAATRRCIVRAAAALAKDTA